MTANSFTEEELDDIYAFAVQLGKDAGKLLLEAAQSRFDGNDQRTEELVEKDSSVDIVTKTDEGEPCHAMRRQGYCISQVHSTDY
jgi:myo-inositol-1(or 4)-monophosphatase